MKPLFHVVFYADGFNRTRGYTGLNSGVGVPPIFSFKLFCNIKKQIPYWDNLSHRFSIHQFWCFDLKVFNDHCNMRLRMWSKVFIFVSLDFN